MAREIFISHATVDRNAAMDLCAALERAGFSCWIAPRDILPGRPWAESVYHGLYNCQALLALLSRAATQSRTVLDEVQFIYNEKKQIIPIRLEDEPLVGGLALLLGSLQWIDLFGNHIDQKIGGLQPLLPKPRETDVEPELVNAVTLLQSSTQREAVDRALEVFNRILIRHPSTSEAYYHRGYIFVLQDLHLSAAGDLTRYLQAHDGDAAGHNLRGHAYNEAGDYARAIQDLSRAIELRPEFGEAYFHRGVAFVRSADYKRALADFRQSLKRDLDPFFLPFVHYNLASVFHAQAKYKQALRSLDQAIELNPQFREAYHIRSQINRKLGNTELARADLKRMARLSSGTDEQR